MDPRSNAGWQRLMSGLLVGLVMACVSRPVQAAPTATVTATAKGGKDCPNVDPAISEIIYFSHVIVLGEVLRQIPDPDPATFTVEMEIYCVYKTNISVPRTINITKAGSPPDGCFSTEFKVGVEYVAYLKEISDGKGGRMFTPAFKQSPGDYVDEIQVTCGINISYPVGVTLENALRTCEPVEYDYEDYEDEQDVEEEPCVAFVPEGKSPPETSIVEKEPTNPKAESTDPKAESKEDSKTDPEAEPKEDPKTDPEAEPKEDPKITEPEVKVGTGGSKDEDNGKEVPYQSGKTGKVEDAGNEGGDSKPDNGSVPLRMPLVLMAVVYVAVLLIL